MVKAAVNRVYRRLLQLTDSETERREFSLTTVANTSQYGMPLYVKTVLNIEDATNQKRVYDISWREFDDAYPGDTTTGGPDKAYPLGEFGVQTQPENNGVISVVSDSNSDNTSHRLRLTGFNSSSVLISELVTVNGTTSASTTNSFTTLERLTKRLTVETASWSGNLTITDADSNTLAIIPTWWDAPSYQWYEFQPIPDAAYTYTVRALMRKPNLVHNEDWPEINEDFHSLLVQGGAIEVLPSSGKTELASFIKRDFEEGIQELKGVRDKQPNRIRTFADIQNVPHLPRRPLIKNIDY